jgi:O-acetyl-ADP-ribose deacetylase (regulator of RNase III)
VNNIRVVTGNLLNQPVDAIVNAWNRNLFPWWMLIPQGVSRAIRQRAGIEPFRELSRMPMIPLGGAVLTSPGRLPLKGIIHVAGINLVWRSSERSVRDSVRNAITIANQQRFDSIAFPIIGAGSGGGPIERCQSWMLDELYQMKFSGPVIVVRYGAMPSANDKRK